IAILVRASFQMREFEDRFVTLGLPYRVIGGPRFYERAEIRDALAYLRVVHSTTDDLAFERIINVPKRGLGDATVQLLHDHARRRRVPLTAAAQAVTETDELKPKPRAAVRDLLAAFERWRAQNATLPHTQLAEIVLDDPGRAGLEEERRLAHVGITRARRRVNIYFAANRRMHGLWSSNIPSRFLDELPEADVEVTESKGGFSAYGNTGASRFDEMTHFGSSYGTPGWQRARARGRFGHDGFDDDGYS